MTKRIKIPTSIGAAKDRLATLDGIATATGWERAAIVWAFTYEGRGGPRTAPVSEQFTIRQFCEKKITGLHRQETVANYRNNWKAAIDAGEATDIKPGDTIVLPDMDWPVTDRNTGSRPTASNIGQQMANDPALLQAAVNAAASIAPATVAAQAAKPAVAAAVAANPQAATAVVNTVVAKSRAGGGGGGGGGGGRASGGVVGALEKVLIQIGAKLYEDDGEKFYANVLQHEQDGTAWKPGELEAVQKAALKGAEFGTNVAALLTKVDDKELQGLLSQEG